MGLGFLEVNISLMYSRIYNNRQDWAKPFGKTGPNDMIEGSKGRRIGLRSKDLESKG